MTTPITPEQGTAPGTGRFVLVFAEPAPDRSRPFRAESLGDAVPRLLEEHGYPGTQYFPHLGIAIVPGDRAQAEDLHGRCSSAGIGLQIAPELVHRAIAAPGASGPPFADTASLTWGLQAVQAAGSPATGEGIAVAVLDTGFDTEHPDFVGRDVEAVSFVDGEDASDGHGHGTHCIGTACGPRTLPGARGYGVAPAATIRAGKVLGADGSGTDASILAGIDWAVGAGVPVISMSLGADVREPHPPYVAAGRRALDQGTLIVAAAGNNARRGQGDPGFVGSPANSPYILAVAALDQELAVADFSARSLEPPGGQVDIAAPGVDVYSSWPGEDGHHVLSGTSMATPHVAGVAALLAQVTQLRGRELWSELTQHAQRLEVASWDVASGLTRAPGTDDEGVEDVPR